MSLQAIAAYDVAALVKDDSKRKNKWTTYSTEVPYFLPILSGFNIRTQCSDRPIKRLGVSIRNIKYTASTRKLAYDVYSTFEDADNKPGHNVNVNVGLFGLWRAD